MKSTSSFVALCAVNLAALFALFAPVAAQTETVLHEFERFKLLNDGTGSWGSLLLATNGNFYGTSVGGGAGHAGTVFRMSPTGSMTILHNFGDGSTLNDGAAPQAALIEDKNGDFYGTTTYGGTSDDGTVFKMTPSGVVTILYSFQGQVNHDGSNPEAALIQTSDGNFYGTTSSGGDQNGGTVFKITLKGKETVLHSFGSHSNDGTDPLGGVVLGTDGLLYGTTLGGGANSVGTAFKITLGGSETVLHSFAQNGTDACSPYSGFIIGSDGMFYGTSHAGGTASVGTVYKMTASGNVTVVYSFQAGSDGFWPQAGVVEGSDRNFYGTTNAGGPSGNGTVFQVTPGGEEAIIQSFSDAATSGTSPVGGVIEGSNGEYYGTTGNGGVANEGTAFSVTTTGGFSLLHSFEQMQVANDGAEPEASLVLGSNGDFYGTCYLGGASNRGNIFKITPSGTVSIVHSFATPSDEGDGGFPNGALILAKNGDFYGTTTAGTVFRLTSGGALKVLHTFGTSFPDGSMPEAGLVQGTDGNFYGTTAYGGEYYDGTVFKMTPSGGVSTLHSFGDSSVLNDGVNPYGGLVEGSDGDFYGTTNSGGEAGSGTVFKITSTGVVTILHSFGDGTVPNDGLQPMFENLIEDSDGNFYGTTSHGGIGTGGYGTVFKITSAGTLTILHSFNPGVSNDGNSPFAGLLHAADGNYYGTALGGAYGNGVIYEMTPSGTLTTLYNFGGPGTVYDGENPQSSLIEDSTGAFYGTTQNGGEVGEGTVFKFVK